jgi:hypothetical protein
MPKTLVRFIAKRGYNGGATAINDAFGGTSNGALRAYDILGEGNQHFGTVDELGMVAKLST